MTTRVPVGIFFALFTVSGFAGLIYESIWSHYLKLFLGHAAYAQTLVLAIFMGGMALGSWLVSRYTGRLRNLLRGYAIAELAIGLLAIVFDGLFRAITAWAFDSVLPALGGGGAVDPFKWALATSLILPASILLGTTFPLMSGALMRLYPESGGRALSMLYFTNSLGAAVGVLASGFFLIDLVGLPGTILTAGLLNVMLAAVVWAFAKKMVPVGEPMAPPVPAGGGTGGSGLYRAVLGVAMITGAASFVYEISWIRMLTLGLGASSHSFEVMLAAFIFGMSLGAFALRNRMPGTGSDMAWLAVLLAAKAAFAVYAIGVYSDVLGVVEFAMGATSRTAGGYVIMTFMGFVASALLMLPTAFCAGMTLPLATHALTARGFGEASIGKVYAFNTAGCIVGAVLATHVGMEAFGVQGLTAAGALLDFGLAVFVAAFVAPPRHRVAWIAGLALLFTAGAAAVVGVKPDELRMSSGVFRYGKFLDPRAAKVEYYRDGKTATVSMVRQGTGLSIRTNGKPDASVEMKPNAQPSPDESTMLLIGALPLAIKPDAQNAAVIGFGAGLTTNALLGSPVIQSVDTIEIEPAMVEAAKLFRPHNERSYSDARSHVTIEDAKTFFAARAMRYDLILSEPSNPWVSGVATLFSQEFYAQVGRYLKPKGLFVQWLQEYELNIDLASTVFQALGSQFADYRVFRTNANDLIIVAVKEGKVPDIDAKVMEFPGLRGDLERLGFAGVDDIRATLIGSRATLEPLFLGRVANSDYFPVLEQRAPLARFMNEDIAEMTWLPMQYVPAVPVRETDLRVTRAALRDRLGSRHPLRPYAEIAAEALGLFLEGSAARTPDVSADSRASFRLAHEGLRNCTIDREEWFRATDEVLRLTISRLAREEGELAFSAIERSPCASKLTAAQRLQLDLHRAVNARDGRRMAELATQVLALPGLRPEVAPLIVLNAMVGTLASNPGPAALEIWRAHSHRVPLRQSKQILTRLVVAQALQQANAAPAGRPASPR
jgi:predicted membrane-bound spermidine synthase